MDLERIKHIVNSVPQQKPIKHGTEHAFMVKELYQMLGKKLGWGDYCLCNAPDYLRRAKNLLNATN